MPRFKPIHHFICLSAFAKAATWSSCVVLFTPELVLYTISGELDERVADILDVVAPVAAETLVVKVTGEGGARRVR